MLRLCNALPHSALHLPALEKSRDSNLESFKPLRCLKFAEEELVSVYTAPKHCSSLICFRREFFYFLLRQMNCGWFVVEGCSAALRLHSSK